VGGSSCSADPVQLFVVEKRLAKLVGTTYYPIQQIDNDFSTTSKSLSEIQQKLVRLKFSVDTVAL
jgi:hypothetical protein